jgi:hypothetical protein
MGEHVVDGHLVRDEEGLVFEELLKGLSTGGGFVPDKDSSVAVGQHHELDGHTVVEKVHGSGCQNKGPVHVTLLQGLLHGIPAWHASRL